MEGIDYKFNFMRPENKRWELFDKQFPREMPLDIVKMIFQYSTDDSIDVWTDVYKYKYPKEKTVKERFQLARKREKKYFSFFYGF